MKNGKVMFSTIVAVIVFCSLIKADQESGIIPYMIDTNDKEFVFVMLGEENSQSDISGKYKKSGLYRKDNIAIPIWTVDWTAYCFPIDEEYLVRKGKWAKKGNYDEEAVSFFKDGKLLKTYSVRDLVYFPWFLPHSSSHYEWMKPRNEIELTLISGEKVSYEFGLRHEESLKTVSLETFEGSIYEFSYETGDILNSQIPLRKYFLIIPIIGIALLFLVGFVFRNTLKNFSLNRNRNGKP
jgi:hypothetical protein